MHRPQFLRPLDHFSVIHHKNDSEYFTKLGLPRCWFLWWDFSYIVWFWEVFLFFWLNHSLLFLSSLIDDFRFQNDPILSFPQSVPLLYWFGSSIPSLFPFSCFSFNGMTQFSMPKFIPMSWLYILISYIRVFSSF